MTIPRKLFAAGWSSSLLSAIKLEAAASKIRLTAEAVVYTEVASFTGLARGSTPTATVPHTHRTVSVFAILDFARYGFGAGAPPSNEYHIKLSVEEEGYVRKLPISHALKAGEVGRFLIQVAADRSSIHDLTFALRFNNDEVVEARVHLELFCHPMTAHFARSREFSQP